MYTVHFERTLTIVGVKQAMIPKPRSNVLFTENSAIFFSLFLANAQEKHADVFDICLLHSSVKIRNDELGIK